MTASNGRRAALLACLFDLQDLVDLMSLATLLVFAVVAACVVVLRYRPEQDVSSSGDNSEVTGLLAGVAENHICNSPQVWPFQSLRPSC